ncbi:MAG: hypothetical protein JNJ46_33180 [Myxococcales bacterium]|nr:hypothetical protein [Myxococcales bacterium]
MAGPRTLDPDRMPLRELVDECLYTAVRIRQSPLAKAQLALAESLLADARAGLAIEAKLTERQIEADAGIALRNLDLDAAVTEHKSVIARLTRGKTEHTLYQRFYGGLSPHALIRLGLRAELAIVEPWIESLKRDPDPALSALATPLGQAVKEGRDAVAAQDQVIQALRDFRADKRAKLFDTVNAGRRTLWAALGALDQGPDFALSFFRVGGSRSRGQTLSLAAAEEAVAAARAQLAEAEEDRAAAKRQADEEAAQEAARQDAARALSQAEAEAQALKQRIEMLRAAAEKRG